MPSPRSSWAARCISTAASRKTGAVQTVDEYIAAAPKNMQKPLRDLRRAIRKAAPKAEETISYRMPCYRYLGWLVFFAAFKNHMSLFPANYSTVKRFRNKLKPYDISGSTIHFTPENPLPARLVEEIVRTRMKENEERARKKTKSGRS